MSATFDALRQVGRLYPVLDAGTVVEVRGFALPERKDAKCIYRSFFSDHGTLVREALRVAERAAVYVGVGARRCPESPDDFTKCPHRTKGRDHVAYLNAAWCELDVGKHDHTSVKDIIDKLDALAVPPNLLVKSGGGVHSYWVFPEPIEDLDRVCTINKALVKRLGADAAFDPSRILRLAGSWHRKRDPVRVELLRTPPITPNDVRCCDAGA